MGLSARVLMLEAAIQVRRKDAEAAQAAAVRAVLLAPYDVALIKRGTRYLTLTSSFDGEKDRALTAVGKLLPELISARGAALVKQKRFDDAYAALTAAEEINAGFFTDFHPQEFDAYRALILALAGRGAESDALAARVQESLASLSGSGFMVQNGSIVATASEILGMRSILRDLASGHAKDARATFRAHGPWMLTPNEILPAVVDRLRAGAAADELTGTLADPGATLEARYQTERMAALSDPKGIAHEYEQPFIYASTADFARVAGATWKVGDKPRFLSRHVKDQLPTTDVLDGLPGVDGLPAGEALLLQAALITKSRGLDGFVIKPGRKYTAIIGLRFGKIGDPGLPALFAYDPSAIIADVAPHIPEPIPGR
jgi:tetratricopeptide (TPR) repeat protein